MILYTRNVKDDQTATYDCGLCGNYELDVDSARAHQAVHVAGPNLLAACKAQHTALDMLMAKLIIKDPKFMPSKSPVWPLLLQGNLAISQAQPKG